MSSSELLAEPVFYLQPIGLLFTIKVVRKVGQYLNIVNYKVYEVWYYFRDLTKSCLEFPELLLQTYSVVTEGNRTWFVRYRCKFLKKMK